MERKEALGVLKTILDRCATENITKVMIMPGSNDTYTMGSQIYIEATFDIEAKKYIQTIAEHHHLAIKQHANTIIIYKPLQIAKTS